MTGCDGLSWSRAYTYRSSACRRLRTNVIVRVCRLSSSTYIWVASELVERRAPLARSIMGGFHRAKSFPPYGEPSSSMTSKGSPTRRSACSPGLAIVAEHRMNCGLLPSLRHMRRRRLMTFATCVPNTPLYTCASSSTTYFSPLMVLYQAW